MAIKIRNIVFGILGVLIVLILIGSCIDSPKQSQPVPTITTTTTSYTPPPTTIVTTTTQVPVPTYEYNEYDNDDKVYVPDSKKRTGRSGHPCLPGERDGDGDGYCGEGR